MRVCIHQPHYFPWLGYLDKIAKCDAYVSMDTVQLTDASNMFRNKFLAKNGNEKFLTVCYNKKGYMELPYNEVLLNPAVNWQRDHKNFLTDTYRRAPFFDEVWDKISPVFEKRYERLCDVCVDTVNLELELFQIPTKVLYQHDLSVPDGLYKNSLVLSLCKAAGADEYLSGNGARKYMDDEYFKQNGVNVIYQSFSYPEYAQINAQNGFVPNLSAVDVLFNLGIDGARALFWENLEKNKQ